MQDKVIIGIMPNLSKSDDDYFLEQEKFVRNYGNRIFGCGAIPIGILINKDDVSEASLDLCDGFLLPGGSCVDRTWYEVINYAIKKNKPLLGICLGSQALSIYGALIDQVSGDYGIDDLMKVYVQTKKANDNMMTKDLPKDNMHLHEINKDNIDTARHDITINKDSILYDIYKQDTISVVSLHNHDYRFCGRDFMISAKASDGVSEGIEYKDKNYFIVGIHFHNELDKDPKVLKRLIKECQKRKNV